MNNYWLNQKTQVKEFVLKGKRIFYIDLSHIEDAEYFINKVKAQFKKKQI